MANFYLPVRKYAIDKTGVQDNEACLPAHWRLAGQSVCFVVDMTAPEARFPEGLLLEQLQNYHDTIVIALLKPGQISDDLQIVKAAVAVSICL